MIYKKKKKIHSRAQLLPKVSIQSFPTKLLNSQRLLIFFLFWKTKITLLDSRSFQQKYPNRPCHLLAATRRKEKRYCSRNFYQKVEHPVGNFFKIVSLSGISYYKLGAYLKIFPGMVNRNPNLTVNSMSLKQTSPHDENGTHVSRSR